MRAREPRFFLRISRRADHIRREAEERVHRERLADQEAQARHHASLEALTREQQQRLAALTGADGGALGGAAALVKLLREDDLAD